MCVSLLSYMHSFLQQGNKIMLVFHTDPLAVQTNLWELLLQRQAHEPHWLPT